MLGMNALFTATKWAIGILGCSLSLIVSLSSLLTPTFSYKSKHVVITGGSSGIGLEAAREYLKRGAKVSILARNMKKLKEAKQDLEASISNAVVRCVAVDVSSSQQAVDAALASVIAELGEVSVIVNSAGISYAGLFDEPGATGPTQNIFENMLRVNVLGSVYPTRTVLPGMKRLSSKVGGGRVVFVSSQVAQAAIHGYSAYGASKWAIRGMAEALQMELRPYNIYVSVCYPPDTDTPGYQVEMESKPSLTKRISESGQVFSSQSVAKDIVNYSTKGYFGISTGVDGWLLKQLHPGMTPINNIWEVTQQVLLSGIFRVVSVCYLAVWDRMVAAEVNQQRIAETDDSSKKTD